MNSYLLIVAVAAILSGGGGVQADEDKFAATQAECVQESGVDLGLLNTVKDGVFDDAADLKCYPKCFFIKTGFMSEAGDVHPDAMKAANAEMETKVEDSVLDVCFAKRGADACETSDLIFKCYYKEVKKVAK